MNLWWSDGFYTMWSDESLGLHCGLMEHEITV